ncbi:MAG TPA: 16S rRNA (guanine(966)-N(2))-methyltransferase RsmD [Geobacteraceae bacterium]|nr:16S rRNA (guanine(966)-N(2))-methyltransferase RsmD [Geobacteraceae bacterium]
MRVIGGTARGRRLHTPRGLSVRPTSDRVKEALFNILAGTFGALDECAVLDVFAGTGNLGIEALSRGARHAVFIDSSRASNEIISKNLSLTGFSDRSRVIPRDFSAALTILEAEGGVFQLVFLDPPYRKGLVEKCLDQLGQSSCIDEETMVVAEFSSREDIIVPEGRLQLIDKRVYGDTALAFFISTRKGSNR